MHVYTLVITEGPRRSAVARANQLLAQAVPAGTDYWGHEGLAIFDAETSRRLTFLVNGVTTEARCDALFRTVPPQRIRRLAIAEEMA